MRIRGAHDRYVHPSGQKRKESNAVKAALRRSMVLTPQRGRSDPIRSLLVLAGQRVAFERLRAERKSA